MKKILYIDKFFTEDLYEEFCTLSLNCEYAYTNEAKRSFRSKDISDINLNLYSEFLNFTKNNFNIEIIKCKLSFYKRKNNIFNPHVDNFPLQILIYLDGEICDFSNGTFFMNNEEIILQTANIPNSAVIFDGRFTHGSIQALSNEEHRGWRYSLNCFISEYK